MLLYQDSHPKETLVEVPNRSVGVFKRAGERQPAPALLGIVKNSKLSLYRMYNRKPSRFTYQLSRSALPAENNARRAMPHAVGGTKLNAVIIFAKSANGHCGLSRCES